MNLKQLNERFQQVYDGASHTGKVVMELPAGRFTAETRDGVLRVYDNAPNAGETHPLGNLTDTESEQHKRDLAAVNDMALSMPSRLAALNRLNSRKREI